MIIGVIPARYASTRFPGKPLALLGEMTMLERCYRQCLLSGMLDQVIIATDDDRIYHHAVAFGARVIMTDADLQSGTDRVAAAIAGIENVEIVVNIQGDEPFIHPAQIDQVASALRDHKQFDIATLATPMCDPAQLEDPNKVKVVLNDQNSALYFSRSPIPYLRQIPRENWINHHQYLQHVGLYAFRKSTLQTITKMPPSRLELAESLEQLRWLEAGIAIHVSITHHENIGIDTPEDLEMAKRRLGV